MCNAPEWSICEEWLRTARPSLTSAGGLGIDVGKGGGSVGDGKVDGGAGVGVGVAEGLAEGDGEGVNTGEKVGTGDGGAIDEGAAG